MLSWLVQAAKDRGSSPNKTQQLVNTRAHVAQGLECWTTNREIWVQILLGYDAH